MGTLLASGIVVHGTKPLNVMCDAGKTVCGVRKGGRQVWWTAWSRDLG